MIETHKAKHFIFVMRGSEKLMSIYAGMKEKAS